MNPSDEDSTSAASNEPEGRSTDSSGSDSTSQPNVPRYSSAAAAEEQLDEDEGHERHPVQFEIDDTDEDDPENALFENPTFIVSYEHLAAGEINLQVGLPPLVVYNYDDEFDSEEDEENDEVVVSSIAPLLKNTRLPIPWAGAKSPPKDTQVEGSGSSGSGSSGSESDVVTRKEAEGRQKTVCESNELAQALSAIANKVAESAPAPANPLPVIFVRPGPSGEPRRTASTQTAKGKEKGDLECLESLKILHISKDKGGTDQRKSPTSPVASSNSPPFIRTVTPTPSTSGDPRFLPASPSGRNVSSHLFVPCVNIIPPSAPTSPKHTIPPPSFSTTFAPPNVSLPLTPSALPPLPPPSSGVIPNFDPFNPPRQPSLKWATCFPEMPTPFKIPRLPHERPKPGTSTSVSQNLPSPPGPSSQPSEPMESTQGDISPFGHASRSLRGSLKRKCPIAQSDASQSQPTASKRSPDADEKEDEDPTKRPKFEHLGDAISYVHDRISELGADVSEGPQFDIYQTRSSMRQVRELYEEDDELDAEEDTLPESLELSSSDDDDSDDGEPSSPESGEAKMVMDVKETQI